MVKFNIHNYEKTMNNEIRNIEKSSMTKRNKELIFQFKDFCFMDGLSKARINRLLNTTKAIALELKKDMDSATKEDIMKIVQKIQTNEKYSIYTKNTYLVILKKFYKWLNGNEEYPEQVRWIKATVKKSQMKLPSEEGLITEEDIKTLIDAADTPRDKALVSVTYESGCRIGEVLSCKLNSLTFDDLGCNLVVNGKTGARKVRLIVSTPYLANWLEHHPYKHDNESPLWIAIGNKKKDIYVNYPTARAIFKRLFKKTGIQKRSNPHLFRHSRATFLASHLTEFQMNQYLGWIQGSKMPHTYVHMSGKEVDNAILAMNKIKTEKKTNETILQSQKCPRCSTVNGFNCKFCNKCGAILDMKTAIEIEENKKQEVIIRNNSDDLMNTLIKDPEIQQILIRKIMERGLGNKLEGLKIN